ncbi:hypothetical protein [Microvirga pudoricolor]|uniref:hypothetical protein n=1 Tax=Microvirga pudoricolor TaxID=2778729 RepID=UPI00194EE903|nr:hypothetical protein [Microvirga pudoricolor]MBM6595077.1 hypothetical protein [Microvirga pudoricolor]
MSDFYLRIRFHGVHSPNPKESVCPKLAAGMVSFDILSGAEAAMDEEDEVNLLADFEVHIAEIDNDWPSEGLVHEIKGTIKVINEAVEDQERTVRWLRAHLFNIESLVNRRVHLMEPYDMRSQHLQDTLLELFDLDEYEFKPTVVRKTGFDIPKSLVGTCTSRCCTSIGRSKGKGGA